METRKRIHAVGCLVYICIGIGEYEYRERAPGGCLSV